MRRHDLLRLSTALFALILAASAATAQHGPRLSIDTDDVDEGMTQLTRFLAGHGFSIEHRYGALAYVEKDHLDLILELSIGAETLDRIVVTSAFRVRDGTPVDEMRAIAAKLNDTASGIHYSVTDDGHLLCQILVTFVDELSLAEIDAAFDYMAKLTLATVMKAPELVQHLR